MALGLHGMVTLVLLAAPGASEVAEQELSVGATGHRYQSYLRASVPQALLEVAYHHRAALEGPASALVIGFGVRTGRPPSSALEKVTAPVEAFAQVQLRAQAGPWELAVGPEVGVSGFAGLANRVIPAEGEDQREVSRLSPAYLGFSASPLRFHLGRLWVSVLELQLAASSFPRAVVVRGQVGFLRLGLSL